jgi:regulator of sigma E protease
VENLAFEIFAATDASAVFTKLLNILSVVLGLGLVIFFHELGHFAVAKWCNVHVERFSIGIGPILWSRQKGETEYALSALPFGGYVKMLGQDDMDPNQMTSSEIAENPRSYSAKSVPQRMAIISAGVIMNVITGFLFFTTCYWFGVFEPAPNVGSVIPGFPAWHAGLRAGDRITAINGEAIRSFSDLQEAVILSSGDVSIDGTHDDGTTFSEVLTPLKSSPGRSVGIRPGMTTEIADQIDKPELISDAGMPLEKASADFMPGDRIVGLRPKAAAAAPDAAANGEAAAEPQAAESDAAATTTPGKPMMFSELKTTTARYPNRDLIYTVERSERKPDGTRAEKSETLEITVPPSEIRSLGLWMAMGPIRAIQKNSIGEKAGLKVGDSIVSVDDKEPGKNFDPLQLPVYFGERAGKPVKVVVKRATSDGGEQVEVEVIPQDIPGWLESPDFKTSPLTIPAIGIGYQVQPRIAHVLPGSEAEKLGVFKPEMKITRVDLIHADPEKATPDAFGDAMSPRQLDLATLDPKEPGTAEEINWAWAFSEIQRVPNRQVRIYFDDGKNSGSEVLTSYESATGWYRWFRGFNGSIWRDDRELQKGSSFGEALGLGIRRTRKTAVSIYMTLRSLFRGNVSVDSLSGPLGIAKIGYMVAERGLIDLLMFLGFLSINLAILNFLPIPILDGGHMVFLLWEGITRRKPSSKVIGWAHGVGLLFIISLFLFVMYVDISSLWGGGD